MDIYLFQGTCWNEAVWTKTISRKSQRKVKQGKGGWGQQRKRVGGASRSWPCQEKNGQKSGRGLFSHRTSGYKEAVVACGEVQEGHHFELCRAGLCCVGLGSVIFWKGLGWEIARRAPEALITPCRRDLLNRIHGHTSPKAKPQKKFLLIPCLVAIELTRS